MHEDEKKYTDRRGRASLTPPSSTTGRIALQVGPS